jgi:PAS domain S-box-containing protein
MNAEKLQSFEEELDSLKNRLIDKAVIGAGLLITPAYIASLLRFLNLGGHPVYLFHTFIVIALTFLIIKRKTLSYQIKTHVLCILMILVSVGSIVFFQTAGDKILAFVSVLIAVLILGGRTGIVYGLAFLLNYIFVFILYKTELLIVSVDLNTYSNDLFTWIMHISTSILYLGIIIFIAAEYYKLFTTSIKNLIQTTIDLRESNKQLEYSEERFKQLSNLTDEGILIHQAGVCLDLNERLCEMTGYAYDELLGKNIIELMVPKEYHELLEKMMKLEVTVEYEIVGISKTGEPRPLLLSSRNIYWNDTLARVTVLKDISEKKNMEKNIYAVMVESEEKERARYAKELHDGLGPLLSTSMIYLNSLKKKEKDETLIEYIDRTDGLIQEAMSSIKEISNNLSPEILRKYGLVQSVRSFIEKLSLVSEIEFEINSNLETRLPAITEFTLYRTLIELINNTLKYAKASKIVIAFSADKGVLNINYSDNGQGFDYDKNLAANTGFGLLNLENRVEKIGGKYIYQSESGKGVHVFISLDIDRI